MTTPKSVPCKNEEGYTVGVRDQIEADYMKGITPAIERRLARMNDGRFCEVLETVQQCRLNIMPSKERIRARREALAKRHAKRAKYKKMTPCIDPRDLPVEAENKILSERGRIGGLNSRKAKA